MRDGALGLLRTECPEWFPRTTTKRGNATQNYVGGAFEGNKRVLCGFLTKFERTLSPSHLRSFQKMLLPQ